MTYDAAKPANAFTNWPRPAWLGELSTRGNGGQIAAKNENSRLTINRKRHANRPKS